jgi:alanyl aminopeptidase
MLDFRKISNGSTIAFFLIVSYWTIYGLNGKGNFWINRSSVILAINSIVTPNFYTLHIFSNLPDLTFEGIVKINITIATRTKIITLNSNGLNISRAYFISLCVKYPLRVNYGDQGNSINLEMAEDITFQEGEATVILFWNSEMTDGHRASQGFLFSRTDSGNIVGATNFEPFGARYQLRYNIRKAFPCFDQPKFKTPFKIQLTHGSAFRGYSNGMVTKMSYNNTSGLSNTFFETTIDLPTYLVAWALESNYKSISANSAGGVSVNILYENNATEYAHFPLQVSIKSLNILESMLGLTLPIRKIDFFPVPDFTAEGTL